MSNAAPRKRFPNVPVRDLARARTSFEKLGFGINPQRSEDKAALLESGGEPLAMVRTEPFFKTFTPKAVCDRDHVEALFVFSRGSRAEVDQIFAAALEAGGEDAKNAEDYDAMYGKGFVGSTSAHAMLTKNVEFNDLGATWFDNLNRDKAAQRAVRRLLELGYEAHIKENAA